MQLIKALWSRILLLLLNYQYKKLCQIFVFSSFIKVENSHILLYYQNRLGYFARQHLIIHLYRQSSARLNSVSIANPEDQLRLLVRISYNVMQIYWAPQCNSITHGADKLCQNLGSPLHQKQEIFDTARCLETAFYVLTFQI